MIEVREVGQRADGGRRPAVGWATYAEPFVSPLSSMAAPALGLLVSAAVTDPAQATLALPMLCLFVAATCAVLRQRC